jgi:ArsR family transcriptional regulator
MVVKQSNYTKIFKALSNEQRLNLFLMIYKHCSEGKKCDGTKGLEMAFSKACGCMQISKSTISHHFKELQNAGLITVKRMGQKAECCINPEAVEAIKNFLN